MTYTTSKSTKAEIAAEAQSITSKERDAAQLLNSTKLMALRAKTGLLYSVSVSKGLFQLEVIDYRGKKTAVINKSEPMPFYEFNAYLAAFEG